MEQPAAIQAKVYHVLPVSTGDKVFSVESSLLENITGTDVQEVYVVDLFLKEGNVGVTLEHRNRIFLNGSTGQILSEK